MLGCFFGFFRKSHLSPTSADKFNPNLQFTRDNFSFYSWGVLVQVKWSKTIQFRDRVVSITLPLIPGSLCPTTAILRAFTFTRSAPSGSQAFAYFHPASCTIQVFTYRSFLNKLKVCLTFLGYPRSEYAGHSFRGGGGGGGLSPMPFSLGFLLSLLRC